MSSFDGLFRSRLKSHQYAMQDQLGLCVVIFGCFSSSLPWLKAIPPLHLIRLLQSFPISVQQVSVHGSEEEVSFQCGVLHRERVGQLLRLLRAVQIMLGLQHLTSYDLPD